MAHLHMVVAALLAAWWPYVYAAFALAAACVAAAADEACA